MWFTNIEQFKSFNGYEIEGVWYPRVTRIADIKAKPALYRFYGELSNFKEGEQIKKNSASEGTLIHETVEKILLKETVRIPASIKPAIDSFLDFLKKISIQVESEFVEKKVINYQEHYAGTLDALVMIDGKVGILDIKTSQAIYRDYNLQTAAYLAALKEKVKNLQTRWILRIDQIKTCSACRAVLRTKGGREKIKGGKETCIHKWSELKGEIELKEFPYWEEDFEAFLGAKKLWEWENSYWLKQINDQ